jgi:hypothetical protein
MTRDLRRYASQTNVRLLIGALTLLFIIGLGLIYLIYGAGAALMGFACLLAALVPMGLIALAMGLINWIVKKANED